jgi:hypothetical protein
MVEAMTDSPATLNLESTFATLAEVGADLNQGTDSLNHILRSVEKKLDQLNLHVEGEVKLPRPAKGDKDAYLGYGQAVLNQTAGWGLYVRAEDEKYAKSVFDCSRDTRIQAVSHLGKLLKNIEARARKIVSDIEDAKTAYLGS